MTRIEQLHFVQGLSQPAGVARRYNCPMCYGHLTLSVNKPPGAIKWHCFRAQCSMGGTTDRKRTQAELVTALDAPDREDDPPLMPRPAAWTSPLSSLEAVEWMRASHVMGAYAAGHAELAFDPPHNRLVFQIKNRFGELVDAAGRALGSGPKWWRYNKSGLPFVVCPGREVAVLVEDCASACAVSQAGVTGIAMLGTVLLASHLPAVRQSQKAIVALDPDAANKALKIANRLATWLPAWPALLPDDPKYYAPDQLRELLK